MIEAGQEYFCKRCQQLRLCLNPAGISSCGNCGGQDVITGKPGSLNKEELVKQYSK